MSLPSRAEGQTTELTVTETDAIFRQIHHALDEQGFPSSWIEEVASDPPNIESSSEVGKGQGAEAKYYPGPINTIALSPSIDPNSLTADQLNTVAHETWHAWWDAVPTWPMTAVSRLSDAQDEGLGAFIGTVLQTDNLAWAVAAAIDQIKTWDIWYGLNNLVDGAPGAISPTSGEDILRLAGEDGAKARAATRDAVAAIEALEEDERFEDGSFFARGLHNESAVSDWVNVITSNPGVRALERFLSDDDRQKIEDKIADRQREHAEMDAYEEWLDAQPPGQGSYEEWKALTDGDGSAEATITRQTIRAVPYDSDGQTQAEDPASPELGSDEPRPETGRPTTGDQGPAPPQTADLDIAKPSRPVTGGSVDDDDDGSKKGALIGPPVKTVIPTIRFYIGEMKRTILKKKTEIIPEPDPRLFLPVRGDRDPSIQLMILDTSTTRPRQPMTVPGNAKGRGKNNYQVFVVIHLLQG